jgi:hypothetical protein
LNTRLEGAVQTRQNALLSKLAMEADDTDPVTEGVVRVEAVSTLIPYHIRRSVAGAPKSTANSSPGDKSVTAIINEQS